MSADGSAVSQRTNELGQILVKLAARVDTRCSEPFRSFIDFDAHTHFAVTKRELLRGRTSSDPRFGVVGVSTLGEAMVVAHTDTTSLARLGKVWSIVEADELGLLSIYKVQQGSSLTLSDDYDYGTVVSIGEKLFARTLPEKVNSMKMNREGKIFLGMGNGSILGFDIHAPGKPFVNIAAHGLQPVIAIDLLGDESIVSVGLDGGLRVSSPTTGQLIGGGKLTKRLEDGEIFSCLQVFDGRAFVGTNKGRVFIFDVSSGNPSFLHMLTMSSYPVRCISISREALLVAYDQYVGKYDMVPKGKEKELVRSLQVPSTNGSGIFACLTIPGTNYMAIGCGDGSLAILSRSFVVYARHFSEEQINLLHYSQADGVLWVGCDDGRTVEAIIPSTIAEDAAYAASHAVEEEKPIAPIRTVTAQSPTRKANPECMKPSPALGGDDSDDEWRKGLLAISRFTNV